MAAESIGYMIGYVGGIGAVAYVGYSYFKRWRSDDTAES